MRSSSLLINEFAFIELVAALSESIHTCAGAFPKDKGNCDLLITIKFPPEPLATGTAEANLLADTTPSLPPLSIIGTNLITEDELVVIGSCIFELDEMPLERGGCCNKDCDLRCFLFGDPLLADRTLDRLTNFEPS